MGNQNEKISITFIALLVFTITDYDKKSVLNILIEKQDYPNDFISIYCYETIPWRFCDIAINFNQNSISLVELLNLQTRDSMGKSNGKNIPMKNLQSHNNYSIETKHALLDMVKKIRYGRLISSKNPSRNIQVKTARN